jgi:hypothetical protein
MTDEELRSLADDKTDRKITLADGRVFSRHTLYNAGKGKFVINTPSPGPTVLINSSGLEVTAGEIDSIE